MAVKGRWLSTIVLPANVKGFRIRAPFVPDWWRVSLLDSVSQAVQVYPGSRSGIGSVPLLGTGQWGFPGEGETDDTILLDNENLLAVRAGIYASSGFPPDSYVPPVSFAKATSAEIQAQTHYNGAGGTFSFNHIHVGGQVVVVISLGNIASFGSIGITGVTVGGITATLEAETYPMGKSVAANNGQGTGLYRATGITPGVVSVAVTLADASADYIHAMAFSYLDAVRMGNTATQSQVGGGDPPGFTLTAQTDGSVSFCAIGDYGAGGPVTETAGAEAYDPIHVPFAAAYVGIYRRTGKGTMNWDFAGVANLVTSHVAWEMLPQ